MFKLVVSLSLVACVLGAAIPDGLMPQLDGRIVGGVETSIESFPYQVSLQRRGSHSCGGSILSSSVILTAAHCLQNVDESVLSVRAGSTSRSSGGVLVKVASFLVHPSYNPVNMDFDIALVRLATPLPLGHNIRTIKMIDSTPLAGTKAKVSGWGTMKSGALTSPDNLRYVEVKIVDRNTCSSGAYSYGKEVRSTMICAAATGKDSCQGDSGGPLVVADGQVGVVSWGYGCASPRYPGIYTDVATLKSWIVNNA